MMQSGEQCVPEILVDPCMDYSTALQLTCPENNLDLWHLPEASDVLPMTKCRVCPESWQLKWGRTPLPSFTYV